MYSAHAACKRWVVEKRASAMHLQAILREKEVRCRLLTIAAEGERVRSKAAGVVLPLAAICRMWYGITCRRWWLPALERRQLGGRWQKVGWMTAPACIDRCRVVGRATIA